MFLRTKSNGTRSYLQLVESERSGRKVRQRVLATLGRLDQLQDSGALDRLLLSVSRFCENAAVLAARDRAVEAEGFPARVLGPALVFEPLWQSTGCRAAVRAALAGRRFGFDVERAVFVSVLHRLVEPGSDRQASRWMSDQAVAGAAALELQHFYRAMAWLGETLPQEAAQEAAEPDEAEPRQRYVKDVLEEDLFGRRRDLFTGLDLVFFDTSSHYFHGRGGQQLGRRGKSKDFRPQCPQVVVGAALDSTGRPLCSEVWPGNTADVTALLPVAERLRQRFGVSRVCLVADRGMISQATMQSLEEQDWGYILGVRLRSWKEFQEQVLTAEGERTQVALQRAWKRTALELQVQEVVVKDDDGPGRPRRYVLCRNEEQARRDKQLREEIVEQLRAKLEGGAKALVGNREYRRYLQQRGQGFVLDEAKIASEERYDGLWALRVRADLSASEAVCKYKELWRVERCFREAKSLLRTRPVYHRTDEAIRGHIFCSLLALVLKQELQARMQAAGIEAEWADVMRDLGRLSETEVELQGKRFAVRTQAQGAVAQIVRCAGASLPLVIRQCGRSAREAKPEVSKAA